MRRLIEKADHGLFYLINRDWQIDFFDFSNADFIQFELFYCSFRIVAHFFTGKEKCEIAGPRHFDPFVNTRLRQSVHSCFKKMFNRPRPYHSVSNIHMYYRFTKNGVQPLN